MPKRTIVMEPHNKVKDAELLSKYDCIKRTKKMVSSEQCSVTDINVTAWCTTQQIQLC